MADVFLSYRKADRARAETLARALKVENLDVWWDTALETGETFDEKIQSVLEQCKAVIVIWSKESVKSDWVRAESSIGRERGILVPVMIHDVNIPVPFNLLQTADLVGWNGDRANAAYRDVVQQVKELAGKKNVPPLKPPPNRALRALWRTVAVVGVIAAIGASIWVFRPWETFQHVDPVVKAQKEAEDKRAASLAKVTAYGLKPTDPDTQSMFHVAKHLFNDASYDKLQADAAAGDPIAIDLRCAVALFGASAREPDDEHAIDICEAADASGDPLGAYYYGRALLEETAYVGMDVQALKEAAMVQFKKASDAGSAWGMVEYGTRLAKGEGTTQDPGAAEALFKRAQQAGLPAADRALGLLYLSGAVVGPGDEASFALIRRAADAGDVEAQKFMGDKLTEGMHLTQDLPAAQAYYKACADSDDPDNSFWCKKQVTGPDETLSAPTPETPETPAPAPAPASPQ